ncbi:hypothetical protein K2P97_03205 [bacterium]|nr:hypothetical protein [bacterium]
MANNDKKDPKNGESTSTATEKLGEALKKIISSGSPTEISKEIIGTVLGQALKAKDDITLKVSNEMIALVQKIDFVKEFSKFAENHKFKVTAEIEILKKDNDNK